MHVMKFMHVRMGWWTCNVMLAACTTMHTTGVNTHLVAGLAITEICVDFGIQKWEPEITAA